MAGNKRKVLVILAAVLIAFSSISVYGDDNSVFTKQRQKILFVVDISNSMHYQDRNKLVNETVKMLVDTFDSGYTSAGLITYNDRITSTFPIMPLADKKTRDDLKARVDAALRTGNTDIGMAINTGMDMLLENFTGEELLTMVLISDGETDLSGSSTGRTMEDSRNDELSALNKAKENNCRIFTVGVSADGSLDTSYLDTLSDETGGIKYDVKNSQEIFDIFPDLYQSITGTAVVNSSVLIGTGQAQSVTVDIPVQYIQESNLVVMNNNQMQDVRVSYTSGGLSLYESKNFTSIKIQDPLDEQIRITLNGSTGDEIRVCTVHHLNFYPLIELPENKEGNEAPVTVRLYNITDHSLINDRRFYEQLNVELTVVDAQYQIEKMAMETQGSRFTVPLAWDNGSSYSLVASVKGPSFECVSRELRSGIINTIPVYLEGPEVHAYGATDIDLTQYFSDADGDVLAFKIINPDGLDDEIQLSGSILTIEGAASGEYGLGIKATDSNGAEVTGTITYESISFYSHYRNQILLTLFVLIILLLALLLFTRNRTSKGAVKNKGEVIPTYRFSRARFEGLFYETASGKEIPLLVWNAGLVENKTSVTLQQLFKMMKVTEKLPEAESMLFAAGRSGTVVFSHNTKAQVMLGRYQVPAGEKVTLEYGNRLNIIFEDGETELEIAYKMSRNSAYA